MAQVTKLQCPHCGAPLQAGPTDAQVVCSYCKHISLLARPNAPAPVQPPSPEYHTVQVPQVSSSAWPLIAGLVMSLGVVGAAFLLASGNRDDVSSTNPGLLSQLGAVTKPVFQFADQPQLIDLNGDGAPELIGLAREPSGSQWIGAYDGKTLEPLWKTSPLDKDSADPMAKRALVPGLLLSADALGRLQAYSDKTGQPAWAALIGERVESFCLGEGFVRVRAADKKDHDLDLTTGKRIERAETPPTKGKRSRRPDNAGDCVPVLGTRDTHGPVYSLVGWSEFDEYGIPSLHGVDGLSAHRALVVRGTNKAFLLGSKSKGTSYPMVAAVEGKKVLWHDAVAGVDPLTSHSNSTTQLAAFYGDRIAIPYEVRKDSTTRMALFDAKTGQRLWDVLVHKKSHVETGMRMTADTIYYASWTGVYLLDAKTGETRGFLGQEF